MTMSLSQSTPHRLGAPIVHPSSLVEAGATLGAGVQIGPFCHIGAQVVLGEGVTLLSHVVLAGNTTVGARNKIFPFASIGHQPQDLKYHGEANALKIGEDCLIREGVTINPGTEGGGLITSIGDRCVLLTNAHVAHDCRLGNNIILSNNVMIAGHCRIGDFVVLSGGSALHQFVRIGAHAFVGGLAGVENDIIPYGMALGNRAALAGLNIVGLKRRGFSRESIHELRRAYRLLFAQEGTLKERVEDVASEFSHHAEVQQILEFIREGGDRAICTPRESKESLA